jgi:hypothetical protein
MDLPMTRRGAPWNSRSGELFCRDIDESRIEVAGISR